MKGVNNVADVVGQLTQRWEQSISPTNRRLNERFSAGEIHVLLLVRESINSEVGKIWVVGFERNAIHDEVGSDCKNQGVLVGAVELREQPERRIPVLVWLEPIYGLNRFPRRTLYVSRLVGFVSLGVLCDRELDVLKLGKWSDTRFNSHTNQLESEMVKRTHQVVDDISSDCGNLRVVDVERTAFQNWLSGVQITIKADSLGYRVTEGENSQFQVLDMLIGPFNFYADKMKSVVGGKHDSVLAGYVYHNATILEAYTLGQQSKEKP